MYQKGSLPIDVIYELFNLDVETNHDKIKDDLFSVKDATFNMAVEEINSSIGSTLAENSNAVEKVAKYLGLDYTSEDEGGGEDEEDDYGFGGGFGDEGDGEEGDQPPEEGDGDEAIDEAVYDAVQDALVIEKGEGEE